MFHYIVLIKEYMQKLGDILIIANKLHCVRYWLKIKHYDNKRIVKQAYESLFALATKGNSNWVSSIRDLLCSNGYGIVWITGEVGNTECFLRAFKQTLIDNYFKIGMLECYQMNIVVGIMV